MYNIGFVFTRLFAFAEQPFVQLFIHFASAELVCEFTIAVTIIVFASLGYSWSVGRHIVRLFRPASFASDCLPTLSKAARSPS